MARALRRAAVAALFMILATCSVARADEAQLTLHVSGWHCAMCPGKTVASVKKVKGVQEAQADFDKKTLAVTYDDRKTGPKKIEKAVVASGFQVEK